MITKLSKQQELEIPKFIDKWIKVAVTPMNHNKSIEYTKKLYKLMKQEEPIIIIGLSPMNTALLCSLFFTLVKDREGFSQLRSQLYSQLDSQLSSQLGSQLSSQLYSQLEDINQNWCLGLWWLTWCAWYDYSKFIGVEFNEDNYDLFMNYNSEVTFIIPYKGIAFISEKPTEIHWKDKRLHNEKGLAVKYPDNYGLYCLNGVGVTKEIVEISAEELDANLVTKEKNAEVRREIVRKIGVERVCQKLNAKVLDKQDAYELLNLDLGENRIRPYLKMINPSIGTFHIEGVSPDCKTVEEALSWRNGTKEKPTILT